MGRIWLRLQVQHRNPGESKKDVCCVLQEVGNGQNGEYSDAEITEREIIIMDKVQVVYWSGTGNTKMMADMIAAGVEEAGKTCELVEAGQADVAALLAAPGFALGSPAMGCEELDDTEMEPLVSAIEGKVSGKQILLFGSYDWGDGEWMRNWTDRMTAAGATVVGGEGVVAHNEPDDDVQKQCIEAGKTLAAL